MIFDGLNVLMSFLAEKMIQNDPEITSKRQLLTQNMQKTLHSDMSGRSAGTWGTVEV